MPEKAQTYLHLPQRQGQYGALTRGSLDMNFVEVEAAFDKVMAKHNGKINKFKGTAKEFIEENPVVFPDFVYIDANHTYEGCKEDIATTLKWKGRGLKFIAGHDYASWCPGVIQAVNEAFGKPDWTFSDSSWLVKID